MPLTRVSTGGENMIIIMGNIDIRPSTILLHTELARALLCSGPGHSALAQNPRPGPSGRDGPVTPRLASTSVPRWLSSRHSQKQELLASLTVSEKCASWGGSVEVAAVFLLLQWGPLAESHWGPRLLPNQPHGLDRNPSHSSGF